MSTSRDPDERLSLTDLAATWHDAYRGRELYRVAVGPGWLRIHLAGEDHVSLMFTDLPGARLVFTQQGPLPVSLAKFLEQTPKHPLQTLLVGHRLDGAGVLVADQVFALRFTSDAGEVVLLSKLFGARGNFTLVDRNSRLLWSVHRPPHTALAAWPSRGAWACTKSTYLDDSQQPLTQLTLAATEILHTRLRSRVNRLHKSAARLVDNLQRDLDNADQGGLHRQKAEALAANLHTMSRGVSDLELASLEDGAALSISLDPARTPAENMEAWFRRARKARKGLLIIQERHETAVEQRDQLVADLTSLQSAHSNHDDPTLRLDALQSWLAEHPEHFKASPRRAKGRTDEEPARPFRRYLADGLWDVWVGRNNKENDELTHRAAHNRDIWLHAQGVAGSHVIIRTGGQPERISKQVLTKAAALAALHSKAKHAQHVPVIYTEKRYVRKPRKAPAGTATCLRDQNIFVEPGVMKGVETA